MNRQDYSQAIEALANAAARLTEDEYVAAGHSALMSWPIAREAARDRGIPLVADPDAPRWFDRVRADLACRRV